MQMLPPDLMIYNWIPAYHHLIWLENMEVISKLVVTFKIPHVSWRQKATILSSITICSVTAAKNIRFLFSVLQWRLAGPSSSPILTYIVCARSSSLQSPHLRQSQHSHHLRFPGRPHSPPPPPRPRHWSWGDWSWGPGPAGSFSCPTVESLSSLC